MRKMKPAGLLLALAVTTMEISAKGAHNPFRRSLATHKVTINQTKGGCFINSTVINSKLIFGFEATNNKSHDMRKLASTGVLI